MISGLTDIYNPFSLLNAFSSQMIQDYWFRSGTPSYLVRLLRHTKENLDELTGRYYEPQEFVDYKADVEKPLPMIYQSGYLTIKDYDLEENTYLLDFPNNEVKSGFVSLLIADYLNSPEDNMASWIRTGVRALKEGDPDKFRRLLTSFLSGIPYTMRRKENEREKERYFHYTFYLIMRLVSVYTVYTEKEQSEGRVDCIVETDHYVYIFEFKLDGTAAEALRQIGGERLCPSVSGRSPQTLPHRCELFFRNGNGGGLGNGGIRFLSGKTGKWATNQGSYSASSNRYFTP